MTKYVSNAAPKVRAYRTRPGNLDLVLWGLAGAALILIATARFGIGLSPDSVGYLATAGHIAAGAGVTDWLGEPLLVQPPLYPFLLAGFLMLPGLPPLYAAAWLNALLFGGTLFLAGRLARRYWGFSRLWLGLFLGTLLTARPLFLVGATALSETLFTFCLLLFVSSTLAWRDSGAVRHLLAFALAAAAAAMTRYIGVSVIATGCLAVLLLRPGRSFGARTFHAVLFIAVAATPLFFWLLRNHHLSGTWMGPRGGSGFSLTENLVLIGMAILCWYIPLKELQVYALLKKLYLGMTGAASAVMMPGSLAKSPVGTQGRWAQLLQSASVVPGLYIVLYSGLLLHSATTTGFDQIGDRLLAPLYIPLTLLLFARLRSWTAAEPRRQQWPGKTIPALILVCCVLVPGAKLGSTMSKFLRDGVGMGDATFGQYNTRPWRESETLEFMRRLPEAEAADAWLYSNSAPAVYQWTGLRALPILGSPAEGLSPGVPEGGAYVAWLHQEFLESRDPESFFTGLEWERAATLADGIIYRIKGRVSDTSASH